MLSQQTPNQHPPAASFVAVVCYNPDGQLQLLKRYDHATHEEYDAFLGYIEPLQNDLPRMLAADRALSAITVLIREVIQDLHLIEDGQINKEKMAYAVMAICVGYDEKLKQIIEKELTKDSDGNASFIAKAQAKIQNTLVSSSINTTLDLVKKYAETKLIEKRGLKEYQEDQRVFAANQAKYEAVLEASQITMKEWLYGLQNQILTSKPATTLSITETAE